MNLVQFLFRKSRQEPQLFANKAHEKLYGKLSPVLDRVVGNGEEVLGYCLLVEFPFPRFFFDIFNPLVAAVTNIVRAWAAQKDMLIVTDRRLLLLKINMLATYGGEAREILYGDIRNVALLRSRLNRSIKIKLILKDNTAVLLEAVAARPLRQMHDLMRQRIAPESSPAAPQAYEHYRTCCRCGNIYTGGAACPACGFKRLSPALAAFFSLVFPGLGQLYVGQIILGTIFIACQIVTLCFAYIYIYQWIGRLHETAVIIVVQAALNILDSMIKAYAAAHELNA